IVRGSQYFLKAQVCAGLTAIVVRVDKVDPEALKAIEALAGGAVGGQCGAHLGIVQWQRRKKDAVAVQQEISAVNPELAETEAHWPIHVQEFAGGVRKLGLGHADILRSGSVPEKFRHPGFGERDAAPGCISAPKGGGPELLDWFVGSGHPDAQG